MRRVSAWLAAIFCFFVILPDARAASYPNPERSRENGFQIIRDNIGGFLGGKTLDYNLYFGKDGTFISAAQGSNVVRGTTEECTFDGGLKGIVVSILGEQCLGVSAIVGEDGHVYSIYFSYFDGGGTVKTKEFGYICQCIASGVREALKRESSDKELQSRGLKPENVSKLEANYRLFIQARFCSEQDLMFDQNDVRDIMEIAKRQEAFVNDSSLIKALWEKSNKELKYSLSLQKSNFEAAYGECQKLYMLYSLSNQGATPQKPF
ncbi:hypothetical protein [Rhizobium phaseoli]|uniref:hypothetical protein n=1 Tax=Rhizobium phaseoli TaxID=396 RepID=UPI0014383B45|nr:hypothetical protein [Rhizobium phaseoli]MDK4728755.1 hypothetical protein [Rhizobium phaseoli]NKE86836.1 hypothetical protein [Rhizobium phaseoli]